MRFSNGCLRLLLLLLIFPLAEPLQGQATIASDRPGIGSGSFVLDPGTLQLEVGGEMAQAGDADLYSVGQLLFRAGAFKNLELQAQVNSFVFLREAGGSREGFQDLGLGAKLRVFSAGPGGSSLSVLTSLSLPTGSDFLSSDETIPSFRFLSDLPLAPNVGVSANLGCSGCFADAEDRVVLTLTPSFTLPGVEPMGVFLGYAGFFADSGDQHFLEGGVTWLPSSDLQLDLNGGVDVDSGDFFLGLGLATRWLF